MLYLLEPVELIEFVESVVPFALSVLVVLFLISDFVPQVPDFADLKLFVVLAI